MACLSFSRVVSELLLSELPLAPPAAPPPAAPPAGCAEELAVVWAVLVVLSSLLAAEVEAADVKAVE
jgi:hypothetical protein